MTDYKALCAELLSEYEYSFVISEPSDDPLVQRAYAALAEPEGPTDAKIERDAARYRWIKSKKVLTLQADGCPWFREDGTKYYPSHFLNVNGTGFNGIEHLDDLIDQAMELYP